jgi:hypothetical protein
VVWVLEAVDAISRNTSVFPYNAATSDEGELNLEALVVTLFVPSLQGAKPVGLSKEKYDCEQAVINIGRGYSLSKN